MGAFTHPGDCVTIARRWWHCEFVGLQLCGWCVYYATVTDALIDCIGTGKLLGKHAQHQAFGIQQRRWQAMPNTLLFRRGHVQCSCAIHQGGCLLRVQEQLVVCRDFFSVSYAYNLHHSIRRLAASLHDLTHHALLCGAMVVLPPCLLYSAVMAMRACAAAQRHRH